MNIDKELDKMKKYLEDNIVLNPIEITDYSLGGKQVVFHRFCMMDDKMTKLEYSFHISHYENPSDNYANAEYLLHVDTSYNLGGSGYANPYNSIEDFINDSTVKKLIEEFGVNTDTLDNQMSIFDVDYKVEEEHNNYEEIQFNFDNIENNDPIEELLSYGIDAFYVQMLEKDSTPLISKIKEELSNRPKYNEYMEKLGKYLKSILPVTTYEELGNNFTKKCLIETDSIGFRVNGNRQRFTAYCLQQYLKSMENKSLFD